MQIFVNIVRFCYSQKFSFDNGWSVLVEDHDKKGATVVIVPTQVVELVMGGADDKDVFTDHYTTKNMRERGDLFRQVKSDNKLVNILGHVKNRPMENHLADINAMIMKAGK